MKKLFFILLLMNGFSQLLSAQATTDTSRSARQSDRDLGLQYRKKANTQRTVGWVLLGAGISMQIIGAGMISDDLYEASSAADVLFMVGAICTITSIPVFINGSKNRGRAEMLLRHENIRVYNNSGSGKEGLLSLALSIPLGRSRK